VLGALALTATASLLVQSYLAAPRHVLAVLMDTAELFLILPIAFAALIWPRSRVLGALGSLSVLLSALALLGVLRIHYGSLFLLLALWLLGDTLAIRRGVPPLAADLCRPGSRFLLPVLVVSLGVGLLVEVANAPSRLWTYSQPFPSLLIGGVPLLPALFGWVLWTLCLVALLRVFVGVSEAPVRRRIP